MSAQTISRLDSVLGASRRTILESYLQNKDAFYVVAKTMLDDYNRFPDKPLLENLVINLVKVVVWNGKWQLIERPGKAYEILMQLDLEPVVFDFVKKILIDDRVLEQPGVRIFRRKV